MHHVDSMNGKITEEGMFRRSSCLSHSPESGLNNLDERTVKVWFNNKRQQSTEVEESDASDAVVDCFYFFIFDLVCFL